MNQFRELNVREHADTMKTPAPEELSTVTSTVVPSAGRMPSVTFTEATRPADISSGQGAMLMS